MKKKWELFSHDADMGIRGKGLNFEEAFEQGGLALTGILLDPHQIDNEVCVSISCSAPKMDTLFYDWINELIYEMAQAHLIFGRFNVKIKQDKSGEFILKGDAWGEKIDALKHKIAVEVKGATYTELKAEQLSNEECFVQCIVDV